MASCLDDILMVKSRTWEETRHSGKDRAKVRSKTFKGIAFAMAEQWGNIKEDNDDSDERGI